VPFKAAEPGVDHGDGDGRFVPYGEFLEAGCHAAVLFEQVDTALHGVTLPVSELVERRWPPASRATVAAVGGLVGLDGMTHVIDR
jgi:hypothetical protein